MTYNSNEAQKEFEQTGSLSQALRVGFPYAEYIISFLSRSMKCQDWMVEEAIQEAWMELLDYQTDVDYLLGYLISHVRNRTRNIIAKERRFQDAKKLV